MRLPLGSRIIMCLVGPLPLRSEQIQLLQSVLTEIVGVTPLVFLRSQPLTPSDVSLYCFFYQIQQHFPRFSFVIK